MSANIANQVSYLRTSRDFPTEDVAQLSIELSKAYIDIANSVNVRTTGIFSINKAAVTGNNYYFTTSKQQSLRQIYTFTSAGSIPHGINVSTIYGFIRIYGTFTNGTNWYPLPYVDVVSVTNQVNVIVTPTNIVITAGGGTPPTITRGFVVLEWISNP